MKRKLDENDVPSKQPAIPTSFDSIDLDPRILKAVRSEKYNTPTPVQAAAIPLILQGKDVLGQANTGSGKTAAYVLPIIHIILQRNTKSQPSQLSTLILVPSRELAEQVQTVITTFAASCSKDVQSLNLTQRVADSVLQARIRDGVDIVIATPSRANQFVATGQLDLNGMTQLIIDEADLVLSYGYEADMSSLAKAIPRGVQAVLMSATLTTEVETLKDLFCRDPITLRLEDKDENDVTQYIVKCAEDEKFLLIFVMFKLKLIKGKTIVFVGNIDRSYRLKLYLEQFGIRSCILNSELPLNSRLHVVQEFNNGLYDIIIATDDTEVLGGLASAPLNTSNAEAAVEDPSETHKHKKAKQAQRDFGVSRGIDFQNVACVLNFDLPQSSKSYTHRIGRTARAGKSGMALSLCVPSELFGKHRPTSFGGAKNDEKILEKITHRQEGKGKEIKPYHFDMAQVESFRYRMNDALRAVTRIAVREARAHEIKQELLKSDKLKKHFEDNPEDLKHLRHDGESRVLRTQSHLKHVPDYLLPAKGRKSLSADEVGFIGLRKTSENKARKLKRIKARSKGKRRLDPLKSFNTRRK